MNATPPERTLLGAIFQTTLPESAGPRAVRLGSEAAAVTCVSAGLPLLLGLEQAGLISLFLTAAALSEPFGLLLDENRRNIWERRVGGWQTNRLTVIGFLALFGGVFAGYTLVASVVDERRLATMFAFTLEAAALGGERLETRHFGSFLAVLGPNAGVLLVAACLAFVYRAYGAMLALTWNACVWAIVITILVWRSTAGAAVPRSGAAAIAVAAVVPHLALESLAYVAASLGALFASKGLSTYAIGDPRLRLVLRASVVLLAVGGAALVAAAAAESLLVPFGLSYLTTGSPP